MSAAFEFLCSQSDDFFDRLYGSEDACWACQSVFQSLSAVSKTFVLRLMFLGAAQYTSEDSLSWLIEDASDVNASSLKEMMNVRIVHRREGRFSMNMNFQQNFKLSLNNCLSPWYSHMKFEETSGMPLSAPSVTDIEARYSKKWNAILRYLVTTEDSASGVHETAKRFFLSSGLVAVGIDEGGVQRLLITVHGYEYMLKDQATQVWAFVLDYLGQSERPDEVLSLMFQLSFCEVGKGYPFNALTEVQKTVSN